MSGAYPFTVLQLKDSNDPKVGQAKQVLLAAFGDDYTSLALVGGDQELLELTYSAIIEAILIGGELYVAVDDKSGDVVGTAGWYPPGSDFLADEAQMQGGFNEFFELLEQRNPKLHHWWFNTFLTSVANVTDEFAKEKDFKMKNWNIYSLGTRPDWQRRGVATQLLRIGEEKAAKSVPPTRVGFEADSPDNVHIYNRWGYTTAGSKAVDAPPGVDFTSYVMYVLVKDPLAQGN